MHGPGATPRGRRGRPAGAAGGDDARRHRARGAPCYPCGVLPAGLQLAFPWALIALPLLFLLPGGRGAWWRRGALALLLLALAQPAVRAPGERTAVLVDVSDSVGDNALQAVRGLDLSGLGQAPLVYYVAGDSARVVGLDAQVPDVTRRGATDLARALQVAASSGAGRVLLASDGIESRGHALQALPDLPVDTLAVPSRANLRVTQLLLPSQAAPGERVEAVAVVETDEPGRVTLHPSVGDQQLATITRDLPAGRSAVPFTFTAGGAASVPVSVTADAAFEQPTGDDRQSAELTVRARPPVLVIGDPAMAALLRTQGIAAVDGTVADVRSPLEAGAVVLRDGASDFTPGQLEVVKQYVETGGGLLMTGGPHSFGLGGWYRTAVEDVLPVTTDLRTEVSLPLVAMVIVLDRSQSMSAGQPSKIELAKEGAVQVVDLAYKDDLLGLIAFSDPSSTDWVFSLRPATERGKREMLNGILGIDTAGGTVLGPAYREALDALRGTEAAVKHVIVLSDGKLYDGQGPFAGTTPTDFRRVASRALGEGITTSTIAIGESADFEQLRAIATAGGGRYYEALDVSTLPQIFTNEALTATRALLVDEPTQPIVHPNPLVALPADLPAVQAYVATSLKPDAQMVLEGRRSEPILATGRAGLGRTAALTTDLNAWAGDLGAWPGLPGALGTLTRWLQARPLAYQAIARRDGGDLQVVVDAVQAGEYVNNKQLTVRFGGAAAAMEQVAPGRYQARVPFPEDASGSVVVSDGSEAVARAQVAGPDPEFADVDGAALLGEIARRSGGTVVEPGARWAPVAGGVERPLWPPLALAGMVVFVLELLLRRLRGETPRPAARGTAA